MTDVSEALKTLTEAGWLLQVNVDGEYIVSPAVDVTQPDKWLVPPADPGYMYGDLGSLTEGESFSEIDWSNPVHWVNGADDTLMTLDSVNGTISFGNEIVYPAKVSTAEVTAGAVLATDSGNPKDAIGALKPDPSLVPQAGILHEAMAFQDGATKYGAYNWREKKVKGRVYVAAAMRHLGQYLDGENFDPKSKVHHLGHARACLGIILDALETGNLIDNRPVAGAAPGMIRYFEKTGSFEE